MQNKIAVSILLSVVLLGAIVLLYVYRAAPVKTVAAEQTSAIKPEQPAATSAGSGTNQRGGAQGLVPPAAPGSRELFLDEGGDPTSRFAALVRRANSGDRDAVHFALQMAYDCDINSRASMDKSIPSNVRPQVRSQVIGAMAKLNAGCAELMATPEFSLVATSLKSSPRDSTVQDIRSKIKTAFADKGPQGAMDQALEGLASRPDDTTVYVIAETLGELDILNGPAGLDLDVFGRLPDKQRELLTYALNIVSCDYGRPCGPGSKAVAMYCAGLGVCAQQGESLEQLYANNMLSGDDMEDVRKLVLALRKLPLRH